MTRHFLIAGTTGSGKTMTCLSVVFQAWKNFGIPFLVLETAEKAEYGLALGALMEDDLQVFTVGDEKARPLHLDLLRVPKGISVEYHIGRLMQIFRAAFPLYPPAPLLLKEALYRLYEIAGWDIEQDRKTADGAPIELNNIVEIVRNMLDTKYSRYDGELRGTVEASLLLRMESLAHGSSGKFLGGVGDDESRWEELLRKPLVLEFKSIADEEEKALAVLFLLYRIMAAARFESTANPRRLHLTVVEEAHRVLRDRERSNSPDVADPRGAVVEEFANGLAEMRGFGEGLIILDQSPSRLSPAVISNTNLRIVHRLPAEPDQRVCGEGSGLSGPQRSAFSRLQTGEALWFPAEGGVFQIRVDIPTGIHSART